MSTFEMFLRLPASEQRRIVKSAKAISRLSRGAYDLQVTAEVLVHGSHTAQEQQREYRAEQRRSNFR